MSIIDPHNVLKGLQVWEAMRRQVIRLTPKAVIAQAIRAAIKYKVNALLIVGEDQEALGVVTKTDLTAAYFAGLPLETPLQEIMVGPPKFCHLHDPLDEALNVMRAQGIHRLYVWDDNPRRAVGVLAYPDIVGLLYRFCHRCSRSILRPRGGKNDRAIGEHWRVREVMTVGVKSYTSEASLAEIMTGMATHRLATVLITGEGGQPVGVVSKTDLILAYKHGLPYDTAAGMVMNAPVQASDQEEILALALKKMIFSDIHRLFVYKGSRDHIVGVLSLSDAARFRSGTCRACLPSRITVGSTT